MKRKLHTFSQTTQKLRYVIILFIFLFTLFSASNFIKAEETEELVPVTFSILPTQINLSGATPVTNTIELDSEMESVGFIHTEIIFNPSTVSLSEIIPSPIFNVINITSTSDANKSGIVSITLGMDPQSLSSAPSGIIKVADLKWIGRANTNQTSAIAFRQNTSQMVNIDAEDIETETHDGIFLIKNPVSPTPTPTPVPTSSPAPTSISTPTNPTPISSPLPFSPGLIGSYYNGINFDNFVYKRIDPKINFNWWMGSSANGIHINRFSIRWTGFFKPTKSGKYIFYTKSDDGTRLWVNNNLIIDDWSDHDLHERSAQVTLTAGQSYPIKIEYYENTGRSQMQLYYSGPGIKKTTIPSDLFIP